MPEQNNSTEQSKEKKTAVFPAVILLILGVAFLAANFLPSWNWEYWWPIFVLVPGLAFYIWFFVAGEKNRLYGILIPGSILTFMGLFFFIMNSISWRYMEYLWPTFILIPGMAFFVTYFGSQKTMKPLLIPATILSVLSLFFYANMVGSWKLWPLILIAVAVFMFFRRK
ncbi:MAG: hypothetical protein ABIH38_00865 [Patescibacteria group bacterium]